MANEPESLLPLEARDLATWLGEPITEPGDIEAAESALEYAAILIEMETQRPTDYWDKNGLPRAVKGVWLSLAAYGYRNPESWANEGVDDWRGGGRPVEELGIYLTPTQKRILRQYAPKQVFGIAVLDTYKEDDLDDTRPWFDSETGGIPDWRVRP